jgi:hypothetical protein
MQKETGRQRMKQGGGWNGGGGRHAPTLEERTEASRKGRRVASLGGYGRGALGGKVPIGPEGGRKEKGFQRCCGQVGNAGDGRGRRGEAAYDGRRMRPLWHRTRCRAVWTVSHGQLPHPHAGMNDRRWVLTIRRQGRTWAQTMNNIWQGGPWWEGGGNGNATESGGTL